MRNVCGGHRVATTAGIGLFLLVGGGTGCFLSEDTVADLSFAGATSASNTSGTEIVVSWSAASGSVSKYTVYEAATDGSLTAIGTAAATDTSYKHTGLTDGTTHAYVVRAANTDGLEDSNTTQVKAIAFSGITSFSVTGTTSALVTFPSAAKASAVQVSCKTSSTDYSIAATPSTDQTSAALTGLTSGAAYTCKVHATYANKEDGNTLTASATLPDLTFAGATSATALDSGRIQVSWAAGKGASIASYKIHEAAADGSLAIVGSAASNKTSYVATGLTAGTLHTYVVRALDASGFSDSNTVKVASIAHAGISSLSVVSPTSGVASFPAITDGSGMKIYCAATGGAYAKFASVSNSATSTTITGFTAGSSYTCKVTTIDSDGATEYETPTTVSAAFPSLTFSGATSATAQDSSSILVSWAAGTGSSIASYKVYEVSQADASLSLVSTATTSVTSYAHTGLTAGSLHTYVVRAADSSGITDGNSTKVTAMPYAGISTLAASSTSALVATFPSATAAGSLRIYCKTSSGSYSLATTSSSSATSASITGLTAGTAYTCKVTPVASTGTEYDTSTTATATLPSLTFGGAVSVTQLSSTSGQVNWAAGTGSSIASYKLYEVQSDESLSLVSTSTTSATSAPVTGLTAGTHHAFVVRAVDSTGITDGNSAKVYGFPYAGITSISAVGTTSAIASFPSASQASSLKIYCAGPAGGTTYSLKNTETSTTTSSSISGLSAGSTYQCKVQPVAAATGTEYTSATSATVNTGFAGITGSTSITFSSAVVTYAAVEWATGIRVYCKPRQSSTYSLITTGSASATSTTLTGLYSGNTYTCKALAVNSSGSEDTNTATTSFQTVPYAQRDFTGFVLAAAYGDSPGSPSPLPTARQTVITWHAFSNASVTTAYRLFRVAKGGTFDVDSTTACTNTTTATCLVCSPTGLGAKTCTDTAVAASPQQYDYAVSQAFNGLVDEIPNTNASGYRTTVAIPPSEMVLIHRDSVNAEICNLMDKTVDPLNHNRCSYTGLGAVPYSSNPSSTPLALPTNYYDFGYNLFIDRYENACNWTAQADGGMCGASATAGDCFGGSGAPASSIGTNGQIYWAYNTGTCYYKQSGAWYQLHAAGVTAANYNLGITNAPHQTKKRPPLGWASQRNFAAPACAALVDPNYGPKRLMRQREFVAAAAFPRLADDPGALTDSQIDSVENTTSHTTTTGCNTKQAAGISFTTFSGTLATDTRASSSAGYEWFTIGASHTISCVSRYGAHDLIGNQVEIVSDETASCNATTHVCTMQTASFDNGNRDLNGFLFNGVQGVGGSTITSVSLSTYTYFNVPMGLPMAGADGGNNMTISTWGSAKLHSDKFYLYTDALAGGTPTTNPERESLSGGTYYNNGATAGRWDFRTHVSATYNDQAMGFRCALPAE